MTARLHWRQRLEASCQHPRSWGRQARSPHETLKPPEFLDSALAGALFISEWTDEQGADTPDDIAAIGNGWALARDSEGESLPSVADYFLGGPFGQVERCSCDACPDQAFWRIPTDFWRAD